MSYRLSAFGLAKGKELQSDDAYGVKRCDDIVIGVLCDGVGSALGGRDAAQRVVSYMLNNFKQRPRSWSIEKSLEIFIKNINTILYQESLAQFERPELLTTLSIVIIQGNRLYGANVGDSPIFLLRDGMLQKLSFDHVEENSNILLQALGMEKEVEPYFFENFIHPKDRILLCSDGVTAVLDENELQTRSRFDAASIIKYASKKVDDNLPDDTSVVVIEINELDKKSTLKQLNLPIPKSLQKDQIIDGYRLLKPLNGITWLVENKGKKYVMKFAAATDDQEQLDLFIQEAWNATRLEAGFFPKAVIPKKRSYRYYIMEYIEGETLTKRIKKRPLHVDEAIDLGKFLLKSAQYLLKYNLVHGDIKPENIIIALKNEKPIFKLIDFGSIVEIFSIANKAGTPSFLAPERFRGEAISESSEIFAIGVTLYLALTKHYPYGEIEPFQKPTFKKPKPVTHFNKKVPLWLESIILRAIERDKKRRYKHYSEMMYELENPQKVKPYFDPSASLIEREPVKVYKAAFIISFFINCILLFALLK
ncbi:MULTISPECIES: bifunctional protein-serine/threonine kinase/phosphatase [unclassified Nitratiruptor]|uniref:bifunctional protein-serine/threonine kinase/phosphatase n=1 Tax=unclassified Nitratiruptor TaxID=2624044 RepID=UPI001914FC3E|nr:MULTISPECIES: bifunctional protein-serine/threonine kinase/phosphatase [unclassified Nitratiruptor]BCD59791.1 serine/threonine protein kinase [Nitratiruptor sp. YY08-10]BCD63715.1 serine/threonine protein kinase [Nitratiruptor sp. YY08-14]